MRQGRRKTALHGVRAERNRKSTFTLTPRQSEILKLVAMGRTNREIADKLKLSVRTVEVHRFNLMHRLKVRNVVQLLRRSLRLRLLSSNFVGRSH